MLTSPRAPDVAAAVDAANAAIRAFWVSRVGRELTVVEWAEHDRLQLAWAGAVAAVGGGGESARAA